MSKEEFWDIAELVSNSGPVVIRCDADEWKSYIDDYTLIDAVLIDKSELIGFDYNNRVHFKPAWLKDAERTNTLVLINLDQVPVRFDSYDDTVKTQVDFSHLIREHSEDDAYRELGMCSGIFVPRSLRVFIILPHQYAFDTFFSSRCSHIDINE